MKRRNFMAGLASLALAPVAAQAEQTDAERFAALHASLFKRFTYYDAQDECRSNYCGHTLAQVKQSMRGNCLDYGMLLIDECARQGIAGTAAVWCRMTGLPHLVVVHVPSGLVADTAIRDARHLSRRPDLEQHRTLWVQSQSASWDGREGRIW